MATLALSSEFMDGYSKIEKRQRGRLKHLIMTFDSSTAAELNANKGIHLESHKSAADSRARTIEIDSNHRGIVLDVGDNENYILTRILPHQESDRWMANNQFRVNEATGAFEVRDVSAFEATVDSLETAPAEADAALFGHRSDKHFAQLGLPEELLPALRAFTSEAQLEGLLTVLSDPQQSALIGLLGNDSVEAIYKEIAGDIDPATIDPEDVVAAIKSPASRSTYRFSQGDELAQMLDQPLAKWRVYLHHSQQELAYKPTYNGPYRVTGGAGTGKTIVAIHRAQYLAEQIEDRSRRSILFTTFTRNLSEAIERQLTSLAGTDVLDVVEVSNVDSLAHRIVKEAEGASPAIIMGNDVTKVWQTVVNEQQLDFSAEFLNNEWEQVILAKDIESRSDYFLTARTGRGIRLDRRSRAQVWKGMEAFLSELVRQNKRTFLQLSAQAAAYLRAKNVKPFDHIVIDEAQDLHEAQWRMLRAAVGEHKNDMFLVGDSHQRIYDRRSSLSQVGINIRGRSSRLKINYRTTRQILGFAMGLLGEESFDDLDLGQEDQDNTNYYSHLEGVEPTLFQASNPQNQIEELVAQVTSWINDGIEPEAIGVIARVHKDLDPVFTALGKAGVMRVKMERDIPKADGVRLGSMHRMKGLEFLAVAVVNADDEKIPLHWDLTDKTADPVQHRVELLRERCLLYVACTRARDHLWIGWSGEPSRFIPLTYSLS